MKKLISMVEFVIKTHDEIFDSMDSESMMFNYALFLQQKPTLGMFVPCDEDGNVLEEPIFNGDHDLLEYKHQQFVEAEQRVIFEGWEFYNKFNNVLVIENKNKETIYFYNDGDIKFNSKLIKTIEDLVPYNLILK